MVWVDEVTQAGTEHGECIVYLKQEAHYMSSAGIRLSSMIEWLAQSFGYIQIARHLIGSGTALEAPKKAFLVGTRNSKFEPSFWDHDFSKVPHLRIYLNNFRTIGPLSLFDGSIFTDQKILLFQSNLKVYSE
jgi:hypothetical protein